MSGSTVLVVDDEATIRQFCVDVLEREGYQAKPAKSGEDAIDLARKQHFDVLLVDFVMPGMSGLEAFKAIREFDPGTVGILITGYGTLSIAIDAMQSGFKGFITKPFTYNELLFSVSEALRQHDLEQQVIAYRQAAKLKDDFLALISHELRTPLSLILSSTNLLFNMRTEKAEADEKKMLTILKKESNRLSKIIANLLIMSEQEAKNGEYSQDVLNLKDIIDKTVEGLREDAEEKGITIHNLVPDSLPNFRGAKNKIIRLMINLLDNAIKFNRKGGRVMITVQDAADSICVTIEDTGLGISEDKRRNLFDPFYPLRDPMTREVRGLDLGLPVSKKIVETYGGTIRVESEPDKGSKFIITLPRTK